MVVVEGLERSCIIQANYFQQGSVTLSPSAQAVLLQLLQLVVVLLVMMGVFRLFLLLLEVPMFFWREGVVVVDRDLQLLEEQGGVLVVLPLLEELP